MLPRAQRAPRSNRQVRPNRIGDAAPELCARVLTAATRSAARVQGQCLGGHGARQGRRAAGAHRACRREALNPI